MIIHGDSVEKLKTLDDNSVDAVVTDPPYGLKFMGKNWDYDVPSISLWTEVLRVLKPGGHLLSFGGTRTYHRMVVNIEDAGFEIRDQVQWIYGSGFPKSHNIGDGRGTALKPANEPICVARKPLEKGLTIAQNVLKYGTGALNIDATRISTDERMSYSTSKAKGVTNFGTGTSVQNAQGRWPANVLLDETAAELLDEQSGFLHSVGKYKDPNYTSIPGSFGGGKTKNRNATADAGGGASRFFYCAKASKSERNEGLEGMPSKEKKTLNDYVSPSEGRTAPKNGSPQSNFHPTVKPIKLMEYLIKLVTPKGGLVLDPFAGSGSTGVAAVGLGFKFVGIEREKEYVAIAKRRVKSVGAKTKKQLELEMA